MWCAQHNSVAALQTKKAWCTSARLKRCALAHVCMFVCAPFALLCLLRGMVLQ